MKKSILLSTLVAATLFAKDIGIIQNVTGKVYVIDNNKRVEVSKGEKLSDTMSIETEDGSATIIFEDGSVMKLGPKSIVKLEKYHFNPQKDDFAFELYMSKGECDFESGKIGDAAPEAFKFKTPDGVVAIRGTHFLVKIQ